MCTERMGAIQKDIITQINPIRIWKYLIWISKKAAETGTLLGNDLGVEAGRVGLIALAPGHLSLRKMREFSPSPASGRGF